MERKKVKKKLNVKFRKNRIKKKIKVSKKFHSYLKKLLLIIILVISYFTTFLKYRSNETTGNSNSLDESSLPLNEHYKILLPKKKIHNYKHDKDKKQLFKLEDSIDYKKIKESKNGTHIYHNCMLTKAKYENLYAREFVEYYLRLGIDKFYFGDDNEEDIEDLSDVLDDYIKQGIVDIDHINYMNISHHEWYEYAFDAIKLRCKWIFLFDADEFLEFTDKNMTIKTYLDMPIFNKCDVIRIHWLMYDDNNLLYYDKRPLNERFNHSLPHNSHNIYHKPVMRGKDYGVVLFMEERTAHQPSRLVTEQCDAVGNFERLGRGIMGSPKFKYCYIKHFSCKTAEEYAIKMLRGIEQSQKYDYEKRLDYFKVMNELSEEKLNLIENIVNRTFPKYHQNNK